MSGGKGRGEVGRRKVVWQASPITREGGSGDMLASSPGLFLRRRKGFLHCMYMYYFPKNAGNSHFCPFITQ